MQHACEQSHKLHLMGSQKAGQMVCRVTHCTVGGSYIALQRYGSLIVYKGLCITLAYVLQ